MSGQHIYNYIRSHRKIAQAIEAEMFSEEFVVDFEDMFPFSIPKGTRIGLNTTKYGMQIFTVHKVEVSKYSEDMKLKIFTDRGTIECAPGRVIRVRC